MCQYSTRWYGSILTDTDHSQTDDHDLYSIIGLSALWPRVYDLDSHVAKMPTRDIVEKLSHRFFRCSIHTNSVSLANFRKSLSIVLPCELCGPGGSQQVGFRVLLARHVYLTFAMISIGTAALTGIRRAVSSVTLNMRDQ